MARVLVALIRLYQLTLSRFIRWAAGDICRFQPSCSVYALACVETHGALRGSLLSLRRLCRCHPFHPGGFDPPPPRRDRAATQNSSTHPGAADASGGSAALP
jgi:putative membrane protein insertion efficiency factor